VARGKDGEACSFVREIGDIPEVLTGTVTFILAVYVSAFCVTNLKIVLVYHI
jgi:hypothetical protein